MKSRNLLSASLLLLSIAPLTAQQRPTALNETDRQMLIEKLLEIQKSAQQTASSRFTTALSAFRSALSSDVATHDLYIKCIEKAQFEDENKSSQEFREWRRQHQERTNSPEFRAALRHQLNWLVLLIESHLDYEEKLDLATRANSAIDAVFNDAQKLKTQQRIIRESALGSVFARAYNITDLKSEKLPGSPLNLGQIYDQVILPKFRSPDQVATLRTQWQKRIQLEGQALEEWSEEGSASGSRPPALDKWLTEGRPELIWAMEVDCFKAGDQRTSAMNMLTHVQQNLVHKSAGKWIEEFTKLMQDSAAPASPNPEEATGN